MTFDMEGYWLILRVARCVGVMVCLDECGVCLWSSCSVGRSGDTEHLSEVVVGARQGSGMNENIDVDGLKVIKESKIFLVSSLHKKQSLCNTALWKLQVFKMS